MRSMRMLFHKVPTAIPLVIIVEKGAEGERITLLLSSYLAPDSLLVIYLKFHLPYYPITPLLQSTISRVPIRVHQIVQLLCRQKTWRQKQYLLRISLSDLICKKSFKPTSKVTFSVTVTVPTLNRAHALVTSPVTRSW